MSRAVGGPVVGAACLVLAVAGTANIGLAASMPSPAAARPPVAQAGRGYAPRLHELAIGTVDAISTSGGYFGRGVLTLTRPDGRVATISLGPVARVFQYRGKGQPVVRISPAGLVPGDVVVVRGRILAHHVLVAVVIYDTSVNGAVNPAGSRPAGRA